MEACQKLSHYSHFYQDKSHMHNPEQSESRIILKFAKKCKNRNVNWERFHHVVGANYDSVVGRWQYKQHTTT